MATTARIFIERPESEQTDGFTYDRVIKKADGYPESVARDIREWLSAPTSFDFVTFIEKVRETQYPKTMMVVTTAGVGESVIEYEPLYSEDDGGWDQRGFGEVDCEYTVLSDGRIFAGREL